MFYLLSHRVAPIDQKVGHGSRKVPFAMLVFLDVDRSFGSVCFENAGLAAIREADLEGGGIRWWDDVGGEIPHGAARRRIAISMVPFRVARSLNVGKALGFLGKFAAAANLESDLQRLREHIGIINEGESDMNAAIWVQREINVADGNNRVPKTAGSG